MNANVYDPQALANDYKFEDLAKEAEVYALISCNFQTAMTLQENRAKFSVQRKRIDDIDAQASLPSPKNHAQKSMPLSASGNGKKWQIRFHINFDGSILRQTGTRGQKPRGVVLFNLDNGDQICPPKEHKIKNDDDGYYLVNNAGNEVARIELPQ